MAPELWCGVSVAVLAEESNRSYDQYCTPACTVPLAVYPQHLLAALHLARHAALDMPFPWPSYVLYGVISKT